ncbi:hypothetical protein SAMN02910265_02642 [Ruminococcus flavefaciens]|uniref:Uncharacterized protein n=1 Tax=Ruminococcus flavefaciens TaxID=1265 RepID=A0A1H6L0N4_RUMFL|nr:hypothetical protein [Ruminococcus flavefaciens]SEH77722.1 hypothetical protein SAMN02910265_02642 [Ruminococcus flavefaciens]
MTVCRIDDADRLHATYQQKMSAGTGVTIILSVLILFVGLVIYGFVALSDSGIKAGFILFLIPALIVLLLVLRVIRKAKNTGYFMAYVINEDEVFQIDIAKACTNDTLFGEQYSILVGGSLAGFNRIMKNMKKLPTTSYVEEFVCNRRVAEYSGSIIDKVFSISEGKEFLTVKAQLTAVNKSSTFVPTRKKTLYIPQTFTNIDQLRSRLEYLM